MRLDLEPRNVILTSTAEEKPIRVIGYNALGEEVPFTNQLIDWVVGNQDAAGQVQYRVDPTDPAQVRAEDPDTYYRRGLLALLNRMGRDHPRYDEAVGYQQHLLAAVQEMQRHGDSPARQHTREALIAHLDTLASSVVSYSFDELCQLNVPRPERDEKYVIPLANLVRIGWYLSPLGVVLGVAGFARWWWRGLTRASWLFLVIGLVGTFFYVRQTYGTSEQTYIYILRRFVAITYPTFSLGIAGALAVPWLSPTRTAGSLPHRVLHLGQDLGQWTAGIALVIFFLWTGRTLYRHVEYAGALRQIEHLAGHFDPGDVVLFRGGAPVHAQSRDIPDLVTTPLQGAFGLNALTIKSNEPGTYANSLAAQVRRWQHGGRAVFLALSASGGDFVLPGFALRPVGQWALNLPEFEQLTDQKPYNVARLTLPFAIYRLDADGPQGSGEKGEDDEDGQGEQAVGEKRGDPPAPLSPTDFAAQVRGFYLPEHSERPERPSRPAEASPAPPPGHNSYAWAWTNGDALLRLPWEAASGTAARTPERAHWCSGWQGGRARLTWGRPACVSRCWPKQPRGRPPPAMRFLSVVAPSAATWQPTGFRSVDRRGFSRRRAMCCSTWKAKRGCPPAKTRTSTTGEGWGYSSGGPRWRSAMGDGPLPRIPVSGYPGCLPCGYRI
ncbi:MAG: hypothetical protein HC884_13765 [Chloroflexaceae bacterium]|nr:hypothetical protein [Chloroflexaceae bacterium]